VTVKLKHRPSDFRVRELLREGYIAGRGRHRVYLVTKRKLTSIEAASMLAGLVGVEPADVSLAGLKDRQGVTSQFMSVPGGRVVRVDEPELTIEPAGFAREALSASESRGNAFRIRVRELERHEIDRVRANTEEVRRHGLPDYFDEQRFGNLRHGQGWIARELMLGHPERALKRFLCSRSRHDDPRATAFKSALTRAWGDWSRCRDVAGRHRAHHSVFDHLRRRPDDFAGAFRYVATRLRLIHLYAFQSHLWNRAVASYLRLRCDSAGLSVVDSIEGPLVFPLGALPSEPGWEGHFRLPGERLADVEHDLQRELLEDVLAEEGLVADQLCIEDAPGFRLKGEERPLCVRPRRLRVTAPERAGPGARGASALLSFELPRGAYATLVVRRLLSARGPERPGRSARRGGHGGRGRAGRG